MSLRENSNPIYVPGVTPGYAGDLNLVTRVGMDQQAFAHAWSRKPVLMTSGLGPCIALVGYDAANRTGFVTHYAPGNDYDASLQCLLGALPDQPLAFSVSVIGRNSQPIGLCPEGDDVEELLAALRKVARSRVRFSVSQRDVFGSVVRSVCLDVRTGEKWTAGAAKNLPETPLNLSNIAEVIYRGT